MSKTLATRFVLALVVAAVAVPSCPGRAPLRGGVTHWQCGATALNREYHLGRFAVPATAATNAKPAWLKAWRHADVR